MKLPRINVKNQYTREIVAFGGLNKTQNYREGELCDCLGISHRNFPSISPRQKGVNKGYKSPDAVFFQNGEFVIDSGSIFFDGKEVGRCTEGKKQIVSMGTKLIVFPDKIYFDTETKKTGALDGGIEIKDSQVDFLENSISIEKIKMSTQIKNENLIFYKGEEIFKYSSVDYTSGKIVLTEFKSTPCEEIISGDIFINRCLSNEYRIARGDAKEENGKITISTELVSVKNEHENGFSDLRVGDIVEISGCSMEENNKTVAVREVSSHTLVFDEGSFVPVNTKSTISIKRKIPDFNCICNYQNRLWGCEGNTIYASKLGDPFSFFTYNQLSTDSFTVTSNTSGDFTACVPYGNSCLFFKENSCYKLFGTKPSNFQLTESFFGGVPKENQGSVLCSGGGIYFCSNEGICVSYGGVSRLISQKLGAVKLKNVVAGCDNQNLYIGADAEGKRILYVYDIEKELWSIYGEASVKGFCYNNGALYMLTNKGLIELANEPDEECEWSFTLCENNENYHKKKRYNKFFVLLDLFKGSKIKVEASYDNSPFEKAFYHYGNEEKCIKIPLMFKKCHEVRVRISGEGNCIVKGIVREFCVN